MSEISGVSEIGSTSDPLVLVPTKNHEIYSMPGAQLAARRQAMGRSIDEVADQLKLTPRQIMAIEADNYTVLPGLAIVRGFIRAYAKILKMDADPLMAMIAPESVVSALPSRRELSTPFFELRLPSIHRRGARSRLIVALVVLLFVVLLLIVLNNRIGWIVHPFEGVLTSFDRKSVASPASILSVPESGVAHVMATEISNPVNAAQLSEPLVPTEPVKTDAGMAAKQLQLASDDVLASLNKLAANAGNALVLKLREDSWVEIRRANGNIVISRLMKADSSETFNINEPVQLIVGNSSGVDVAVRGVPLEMKHAPGSKIARLDLK